MLRWLLRVTALRLMTAAVPAFANGLGGGEDLSVPWARIALSFLACVGVAWIAIMAVRRRQAKGSLFPAGFALPQAPERAMTIMETRRVSQHGDACLLRCRGKSYLLLITASQVTILDSYAEEAP